jgi:hypothetical protein
MNIQDYLKKLNEKSQEIFAWTIAAHQESLAKVHHLASQMSDFSDLILDSDEKNMLRVACSQLETSSLALSFGLYRQAMSSLRLTFEISLGCVHFSVHKLEHKEWLVGRADIKWSALIDEDCGLFSHRFADAFFPELREYSQDYGVRAKALYRNLSEFVHGNSDTWESGGIALASNEVLLQKYFLLLQQMGEVILYILCCRYLKNISKEDFDDVQSIFEQLTHIAPIRELAGGPKDIK